MSAVNFIQLSVIIEGWTDASRRQTKVTHQRISCIKFRLLKTYYCFDESSVGSGVSRGRGGG